MNGLDIALVVTLFFFFLRGIFRGFIKEITSIAATAIGFIIAAHYYPVAADALKPFLHNQDHRSTIGFLMLFIVSFFVIGLIGILLDKLLKMNISNVTDGLLGAVVALLKGLVLACVVLMVATSFVREDSSFYSRSVSWPYLKNIAVTLKKWAPDDLRSALDYRPSLVPEDLQDLVPDQAPETTPPSDQPAPWQPVGPESDDAPAWPGSGDNG